MSRETGRQVGVLVSRRGDVEAVVVGDAQRLQLPDVGRERGAKSRLRGVRLIHTHLQGEALTRDDLTDLSLLRLDAVAALEVTEDGRPGRLYVAQIDPKAAPGSREPWSLALPRLASDVASERGFDVALAELETALSAAIAGTAGSTRTRAVLVQVIVPGGPDAELALYELRELARTAGLEIVDEIRQRRPALDPKTAIGRGKLDELTVAAMQRGADLAVFGLDLGPAQVRSIAEASELRVIDRTQLILDIFAGRARSREGRLQVELAQLKYRLPRLSQDSAKAFSRLMGGIGGRGPGEQKLEIDRRRVKDRIVLLTKELERVARDRGLRRRRRGKAEVPVVSIVGYTNAGKSTLLNALTSAEVYAENQLFATLDPTSRRMALPKTIAFGEDSDVVGFGEIIVTDTVGFIRELPADLVTAFRATLEELHEADLLLHVIDASSDSADDQIASVESLLRDLELDDKPVLRVLNKLDRVTMPPDDDSDDAAPQGRDGDEWLKARVENRFGGVAVSALAPSTFPRLLAVIASRLGPRLAVRDPRDPASLSRERASLPDSEFDS
ncbi:MAG: GTPase HflX [Myxococcales bacterium]|nr:GTPase HflX [Myxococcales bacterium]